MSTPYKFTSKELDEETGLYYYGARYYDAKLSRWVSVDPALVSYLPTGNKERDKKLPGHGGVYSPDNLDLYNYSGDNPVKYLDPNGCWKDESKSVVLNIKGVIYNAEMNMGTVTDGDTVNKLAEKQLMKEKGTNKFSSSDVKKKAAYIREANDLKTIIYRLIESYFLG